MYYYPYQYQIYPPLPVYPPQMGYQYQYQYQPIPRSYPPVDVKIFENSVKTFRLLMDQGSILLDRLGDLGFAQKMMSAAQQGKKADVDRLISTVGLKVPVITTFTPSGVIFELTTQPNQNKPASCCTLKVSMKWGI
ncbi:hypothetical protein HFZ78_08175 [Priestia megaterium]|jgi:hypothetical protein|uniref:Uncharacterized protein n=1 Tax=Priestia megaterium TaxID=1404 RepID=A0A6H1NZT9_PRIMG|nr:hypothetical protein [Priestia megaterium]QIZ06687.1 hypothetical protein HFZ78_08175 [Priestia megaterium]